MLDVSYGTAADTNAKELLDFYHRLNHDIAAQPAQHRAIGRPNARPLAAATMDLAMPSGARR